MSVESQPWVSIVGAGPGNPQLLTLRAAELLAKADLVIHDYLVPVRMLDAANPLAERICVKDLPGKHPDKYPAIYETMIAHARRGRNVVRLKGGDPLVFGRGGEETDALREAGIAYEIVPGVTAALAAAAYLDLPLTHRKHSSAVALITGHELPNKPGNVLDWKVLAKFPGTLVIYMGVARLPVLIGELLKFGRDPDEPSCLVERAGMGEMRSVVAPLKDLDSARRQAGLEAPGLIIIGETVGLRQDPSWFEAKPLFGKRVMVTRPRHQAMTLVRLLEANGAVPIAMPVMEIREPDDCSAMDRAIQTLADGQYDWVAFTSANAVNALCHRIMANGHDLRLFGNTKIASVGAKTSDSLRAWHLKPDFEPKTATSQALAEEITSKVVGSTLLFPKANHGKDTLKSILAAHTTVDDVIVYDQVNVIDPKHEAMIALNRGEIHAVTLTSTNIARSLLTIIDPIAKTRIERGDVKLIAIGPDVAAAVESLGFKSTMAKSASDQGVVDAVMTMI